MCCKKYSSVIEGLNMLLELKRKEEMNLDFGLISNLTYNILNLEVKETKTIDEVNEAGETQESSKPVVIDEEEFDILSSELTQLEEQLEEEEEEEEAEKKSKNDKEFLIKQLSALFNKIQKMVFVLWQTYR